MARTPDSDAMSEAHAEAFAKVSDVKAGSDVRSVIEMFGMASRVLSQAQSVVCEKLTTVVKTYMRAGIESFIEGSPDLPVLYTYGSDGTPMLSQVYTETTTGSGSRVRRRGQSSDEWLVERGYVTIRDPDGCFRSRCIVRGPIPLKEGEGAAEVFACCRDFLPLTREMGHRGISMSYYVFDRKLQRPLFRNACANHRVYHKHKAMKNPDDPLLTRSFLTDWQLSTGCGNHDAHNATQWALSPCSADMKDTLKALFLAVDALRKCYGTLVKVLPVFVANNLAYRAPTGSEDEVRQWWTAIGTGSDMVEELTDLGLEWVDGKLYVNQAHEGSPGIDKRVRSALLYIFKFKRFTNSRWATIGCSMQSLAASLSVGLAEVMRQVKEHPEASSMYVNHWALFEGDCRTFCAVATLSCGVGDAVLYELLEDDRVVDRLGVFEEAARREVEFVRGQKQHVFERLARAVGTSAEVNVRDMVLAATETAYTYVDRVFFAQFRAYPWRVITLTQCRALSHAAN